MTWQCLSFREVVMKDEIFQELESNVRSYCRTFPVVFGRAQNAHLWSEDGRKFIDFFAGAGALNYGHNNPFIKQRVLEYLLTTMSCTPWTCTRPLSARSFRR